MYFVIRSFLLLQNKNHFESQHGIYIQMLCIRKLLWIFLMEKNAERKCHNHILNRKWSLGNFLQQQYLSLKKKNLCSIFLKVVYCLECYLEWNGLRITVAWFNIQNKFGTFFSDKCLYVIYVVTPFPCQIEACWENLSGINSSIRP